MDRRREGRELDHRIVRDREMKNMKELLRAANMLVMGIVLQVATPALSQNAAASRALTPTDLNQLARVGDPRVSPDGRRVVYTLREVDLEANRGRTDLWMLDLDDPAKPRRLTQHSANDTHPRWSTDGGSVYFLSSRAGSSQVWRLPLAGGEAVQITDYPLDVNTFKFSPDGSHIALAMDMLPECADLKCTSEKLEAAGKNKATARVYDHLFVRHWD